MSKHTLGEWQSRRKTNATNNFGVYDINGYLLATLDVHQLATPYVIERREADARLMAAAPDLLEAARDALAIYDRYCDRVCVSDYWADLVRKALVCAISKAEGKS